MGGWAVRVSRMPAPKAPRKPVVGSLKLYIRAPETAVAAGSEDGPTETAPDLSEKINIKLPRGFNFMSDTVSLLRAQVGNANKRLSELRDKASKCGNCRKTIDVSAVDSAEKLIEYVGTFLSTAEVPVTITVNHSSNGNLSLFFRNKNKYLSVLVTSVVFEYACYDNDLLVFEGEFKLISSIIDQQLSWLIK